MVDGRAAADVGSTVRLPGRGHHPAAVSDRHASRADLDSSVLQFRVSLLAEQAGREGRLCRLSFGPDGTGTSSSWPWRPPSACLPVGTPGAALATVVGVLVEVPVMLLVVRVVNRSKKLVRTRLNMSRKKLRK